ncbi:MAG: hypothetical protein AAF517_14320, partial [Planctomycetota bacterium]
RSFMHLFLGAEAPNCIDAMDANDDGRADLSDGVLVLQDFFRVGTAIADPGPFRCGIDPSRDELSCDSYSRCPAAS